MKKIKWRQLKAGTSYRMSLIVLLTFFLIALFAPIIANDKPLYISAGGQKFFPAFSSDAYTYLPDTDGQVKKILSINVDWKNLPADSKIFPFVAWSPKTSDLNNIYVSPFDQQLMLKDGQSTNLPFRFRHYLGTGKTGNDLLSGLIYGCRTSILIGVLSVLIAMIIGIFLGCLAGYFGDDKFKLSRGSLILIILLVIPAWFYSFYLRSEIIRLSFSDSLLQGIFQLLISLFLFLCFDLWPLLIRFSFSRFLGKKIFIPVDGMISRSVEIFLSLPKLILILTIAAFTKPSLISIILIIGLTSWTETTRIVRAQFLSLRETNYVLAAKAIGNNTFRVLFMHMLPSIFSQLILLGIFGIASAILIETGLSFLGAGVPAEISTWGGLMYQARENFHAWWLVLFSGTAILLLMTSLFTLGKMQNRPTFINKN